MKRLWLADVHANLPAFEAVLADVGDVDEVVFLGDIVGFGPHPAACVATLRQLGAKVVTGNHDASVLALKERTTRRANPTDWNEWTLDQLDASQLAYLEAFPIEASLQVGDRDVDVEQTVVDIQRIALDDEFSERWIAFLRSGFDPEWSRVYQP